MIRRVSPNPYSSFPVADRVRSGASSLTGKVALVTGASGGIGRGIALALGSAGASVAVAARREAESMAVVAALRARGAVAEFIRTDVSVRADVQHCVTECLNRFGRLDTVVHSATSSASSTATNLEEATEAEWQDHAAVSLNGTVWLAHACFNALRVRRGSLIVLTSGTATTGHPNLSLYAATKGAQRGVALALAREWGPAGVRVNCIAPHADTAAQQRFARDFPDEHARDVASLPLRRLGDPERDIGRAVAFLAGEAAGYVTGHVLVVDGGRAVRA